MARSGDVTVGGGNNANVKSAVLRETAPILTLGAICAAALSGSNSNLVLMVDPIDRKVKVYLGADGEIAHEQIGGETAVEFVQDVDEKVAPWSAVAQDSQLDPFADIANAQAKPTRSLQSLLNAIEDKLVANPPPFDAVIFVDQDTEKVSLQPRASIGEVLHDATLLAEFDQEVDDLTSTIKNAFE